MVEVCRLVLAGGDLPDNGGDRPQVVVTVPFDPLRHAFGTGMVDTGDRLSADTARRLACDARILPAVLDGAGQPLDLGRERRLFTGPLRRALVLRDGGCAFPGCDRPPRWCDGHHVIHWADGGPTSLANAVLLCGHHHRLIHDPRAGWNVHIAADASPTFIPPAWLDPRRLPRQKRLPPRDSERRTPTTAHARSGRREPHIGRNPRAARSARDAARSARDAARSARCGSLARSACPARDAAPMRRGRPHRVDRPRSARSALLSAMRLTRARATPTQPVTRWVHPPWLRACATLVRRVGPP